MEIPASVKGTIKKILLNEGDKVKIGMPFIEVVIDDLPDKDIKESKTEIKEDPPKKRS